MLWRLMESPSSRGVHCVVLLGILSLSTLDPAAARTAASRLTSNPQNLPCPSEDLEAGRFLVASRDLKDPNFAETVVLLLSYDTRGALGLVVNEPTGGQLSSLFPEIGDLEERPQPIFYGGPVARQSLLFLLRGEDDLEGCRPVLPDVCASENPDLLEGRLRQPDSASKLRVFAGHAGWAPRQLDLEVAAGGWHVLSADSATIFSDEPAETWEELVRRCTSQMARWDAALLFPALAQDSGLSVPEESR